MAKHQKIRKIRKEVFLLMLFFLINTSTSLLFANNVTGNLGGAGAAMTTFVIIRFVQFLVVGAAMVGIWKASQGLTFGKEGAIVEAVAICVGLIIVILLLEGVGS